MGTRPKPIPDSPKEDSFMCGRYTLAKPLKTIESHFAPVHINWNIDRATISLPARYPQLSSPVPGKGN